MVGWKSGVIENMLVFFHMCLAGGGKVEWKTLLFGWKEKWRYKMVFVC